MRKKYNICCRQHNTDTDRFSNCHRTGGKSGKNESAPVSETDSDVDSANSKYTVKQDNRPRKDGPGGN